MFNSQFRWSYLLLGCADDSDCVVNGLGQRCNENTKVCECQDNFETIIDGDGFQCGMFLNAKKSKLL